MESLAEYKLEYEDMKPPIITRKGGKDINKMSKATNVTPEKAPKSYNKTRGEHLKDIIIAILIVGVVAFALGVKYSEGKTAEMQSAVKAAQVSATETAAKK